MDALQCERDFHVSRETYSRLQIYHQLLLKWQKSINLVAKDTLNEVWQRHMVDSLQLLRYLSDSDHHLIDLGSGAGFPAIPLAIATDKSITLIESDLRKCVFLEEVKRHLNLKNILIRPERIETVSRETADVVIARACAPLATLCTWSYPFLSPQSKCLFPKGEHYATEVEIASLDWDFSLTTYPSLTHPRAAILELTHLAKR